MKHKFFVLLALIIIHFGTSAQLRYYVELGTNYPFISSSEYGILGGQEISTYNGSTIITEFTPKLGADLNVGVEIEISKKFSFETGIGFSQLFFKKQDRMEFSEDQVSIRMPALFPVRRVDGVPLGTHFFGMSPSFEEGENYTQVLFDLEGIQPGDARFNDASVGSINQIVLAEEHGKTRLSYLMVPVMLNYNFTQKLTLGMGINTSVLALASTGFGYSDITRRLPDDESENQSLTVLYRWVSSNDGETTTLGSDRYISTSPGFSSSKNQYNDVLFSTIVKAQYKLSIHFSLSLKYQHSFTTIYRNTASESKYRMLHFGLRYYIN